MPTALVILILLLGLSVEAQQPWRSVLMGASIPPAVSSVPMTAPTNLANCYTFWLGPLTTNAGTQIWSDLYTNAMHLTNSAATSKWCVNDGTVLNGYNTVLWNGTQSYLKNVDFTNYSSLELWIVMQYLNSIDGVAHYIADSCNTSYRGDLIGVGADAADRLVCVSSGCETANIYGMTNRWVVFRFVCAPNPRVIQTNNVTWASGSTSVSASSGITLGASYSAGSARCNMRVVAAWTFNGTNTQATATSIYNWATNTFKPPL